MTAPAMMVIHR